MIKQPPPVAGDRPDLAPLQNCVRTPEDEIRLKSPADLKHPAPDTRTPTERRVDKLRASISCAFP